MNVGQFIKSINSRILRFSLISVIIESDIQLFKYMQWHNNVLIREKHGIYEVMCYHTSVRRSA